VALLDVLSVKNYTTTPPPQPRIQAVGTLVIG